MKLVTFRAHGLVRLGCVHNETVVDLNLAYVDLLESTGDLMAREKAASGLPPRMESFLRGGGECMAHAQEALAYALDHPVPVSGRMIMHQLADVTIEAPVQEPKKIICVGLNYRDHILEMGRELPEFPVVFAKFSNALAGATEDIPLAERLTYKLDYEAELAFVIGKRGRNISKEDAFEYVAGYTVANDITARDMQKRTLQWLQGKALEKSLPLGPYLVTKDELTDPHALNIASMVNGDIRQQSNTANLVFKVDDLVAFLSAIMTLEPGDIICTGTPGGVGEPSGNFLRDGDVVQVEIEGIGQLKNRIKKGL